MIPLSPETLATAYDFLCTTPPFNRWNMPDSEDVTFRVERSRLVAGRYYREGDRQVIALSRGCVGHIDTLMRVMAHEMVHLHQAVAAMETAAQHNAAFEKLAEQVCRHHGFDPKQF